MDTIFINSGNSKTPDPHRLNLSDEINLKSKDKYVALSNLSIYYTWKNIKNSHKKIINLRYQPDGSYSVSDYFDHIIKNHEALTDNPSIMIYVSKIEN